MTDSDLFIWRAICRSSAFDEQCHQALVNGRVTSFVYLSSGQESIAAAVAAAFDEAKIRPNIFCQHRNHSEYISFGGDVTKLRDELLGLESGTTHGIGGDPCHAMESKQARMIGHIGLVGDQLPIAVGMALATKQWSVCFLGDSSCEEDVFGPSIGFAVTHKLPVIFVEADNGLSVITETSKRRSWSSIGIADGYSCIVNSIEDDPLLLSDVVSEYLTTPRPYYIQVKTNRRYKHVGYGFNDTPMKWDRMAIVRERMYTTYGDRARKIESEAIQEMGLLWQS